MKKKYYIVTGVLLVAAAVVTTFVVSSQTVRSCEIPREVVVSETQCAARVGKYFMDPATNVCTIIPSGVCVHSNNTFETKTACEQFCAKHRFVVPWLK